MAFSGGREHHGLSTRLDGEWVGYGRNQARDRSTTVWKRSVLGMCAWKDGAHSSAARRRDELCWVICCDESMSASFLVCAFVPGSAFSAFWPLFPLSPRQPALLQTAAANRKGAYCKWAGLVLCIGHRVAQGKRCLASGRVVSVVAVKDAERQHSTLGLLFMHSRLVWAYI